MDRQLKLVIQCKNLIMTKKYILCNYHFLFGCPQHFLAHKLRHLPTITINPMFFCCFLELLKIQTMTLKTYILTWDDLVTTNVK
jgi:hypothetical protein